MAFGFAYWAWFGTMQLLYLTWQDYCNNRVVDDRKNFFMMGATLALIGFFPHPLWYYLCITAFSLTLKWWLGRYEKVIGGADVNTIVWIMTGLAIINVGFAVFYLSVFAACTLFTLGMRKLFKQEQPTAFYGVLLITFITTAVLMGLY